MATARAINLLDKPVRRKKKAAHGAEFVGHKPFNRMEKELATFLDKIGSNRRFEDRQMTLPGFENIFG